MVLSDACEFTDLQDNVEIVVVFLVAVDEKGEEGTQEGEPVLEVEYSHRHKVRVKTQVHPQL